MKASQKTFLWVFAAFITLWSGMFYLYADALAFLVLTIILIATAAKKKGLKLNFSLGLCLPAVFVLFYLVSAFWAVDKGMAVFGAVKYAWIIPALLLLQQEDGPTKENLLDCISILAAGITVATSLCYFIPKLKEYTFINNRLAGSFGYANAFAAFLLLCLIWRCAKREVDWLDRVCYVVYLAGIALCGCRVVMVLTIPVVLYLLIRFHDKWLIIFSAVLAVCAVALLVLGDGSYALSRITQITLKSSTLQGRFLYWKDGISMLLSHQPSLGYMGFYYLQNSMQTGVYASMFVHNDFLQILLDLGILPLILYLVSLVLCFASKKLTLQKKLMILVLVLAGCMDFDLEYSLLFFVLMLCMDEVKLPKCPEAVSIEAGYSFKASMVCLALAVAYLGLANLAHCLGGDRLAHSIAPFYTDASVVLLSQSEDAEEVDALADGILSHNKKLALAYYAKAMVCDVYEDYESMISYEKLAIENDFLNQEQYDNYAALLYDALVYGDEDTYAQAEEEFLSLEEMMAAATKRVTGPGLKIYDQPELGLSDYMREVLEAL